jgi:hypothetical protein
VIPGGAASSRRHETHRARRDKLLREIALEESRLAALKAELDTTASRAAALREQLASEPPEPVVIPAPLAPVTTPLPMTNPAKVALFRSLFRGREDVFPRRWENTKKGKSGYSPACDNEWEYGGVR